MGKKQKNEITLMLLNPEGIDLKNEYVIVQNRVKKGKILQLEKGEITIKFSKELLENPKDAIIVKK